jgi:hypothetical protein
MKHISAAEIDQLTPFREEIAVYYENHMKQIQSVGTMQSFSMLKQLVIIATTL